MPRKPNPVPQYKRHPNGSSYVYHRSIDRPGHVLYLGPYGSEKSLSKYRAFLKKLEAQEGALGDGASTSNPVLLFEDATILELVAAYLQHCEVYYRSPTGKRTSEYLCVKNAVEPLLELFPDEYASTFGVEEFEAYRNHLISQHRARSTINKHAGRIKRMFRWAASKGKLSPSVWHSLNVVPGLQAGRSAAREPAAIPAIPWETVSPALPYFSPVVAAMVEIQFWCGMRPQDICAMRRCDIDQSGAVWLYRPSDHKTAWRGHSLIKAIPPAVQPLVQQWFKDDPQAYLFSPRDAVLWRAEETAQAANRTTRENRDASRKTRPTRHRDYYTKDTYRQAVEYGLEKMNAERAKQNPPLDPLPTWTPNQLRHGIATHIDRTLGRQAAQRYLGHKHMDTTGLYIEREVSELVAVALAIDALRSASG